VGPFRAGCLALALAAGSAAACEVPGDGTSLRRALLKVKYLAETEAWERAARRTSTVQYVLSLDAPLEREGRWRVVGLTRLGRTSVPSSSTLGQDGDVVLLSVAGDALDELDAHLGQPATEVAH